MMDADSLNRIAVKVQALNEMSPEDRRRERIRLMEQHRKRNCEFCKKHPENCRTTDSK